MTTTIKIPVFLKIAIKKMFFPYCSGEFNVESKHILAVIKHEEELRIDIPTDWRVYMEQVVVGTYKSTLKAAGYTDDDLEDLSRVELRDLVDEECPIEITEIRGTATGKSTKVHVVTKKAA